MALDLGKYFDERYQETLFRPKTGAHPFVTISRQTGCNSFEISKLLVKMINDHSKTQWKLINKELIELSVKELRIDQHRIEKVFGAQKHDHIEEILQAFGDRYYKSDQVIRRTIRHLIQNIASDGFVVIVGRAGAAITAGLPDGLHVRLEAPLGWRVRRMAEKKKISEAESRQMIENLDKSREQLFMDLGKMKIQEIPFDLRLNNQSLNDHEIARMIFELLRHRSLL